MVELWKKKTIYELLAHYQKDIKKSLGQHYLIDYNILKKIALNISSYGAGSTLIEIGPGLGSLTQACLLETNLSIIAIEIEKISSQILEDIFSNQTFPASWQNRLKVINQNILDFTPTSPPPYFFTGNLPYNLATKIIIHILEKYQGNYQGAIFMMQKEVADRILARKGKGKDYSRLTIMISGLAIPTRIFNIPQSVFFPQPKVTSSILLFKPHQQNLFNSSQHYQTFKSLVKAAFHNRRKQILKSLELGLKDIPIEIIKNEMNTQRFESFKKKRAEEWDVEDFISFSRKVSDCIKN